MRSVAGVNRALAVARILRQPGMTLVTVFRGAHPLAGPELRRGIDFPVEAKRVQIVLKAIAEDIEATLDAKLLTQPDRLLKSLKENRR